ncbi:F0F1 ATP synthase subunit delta [Buchnera aphidicola]|uniref:F0F1 ATP synthase subunit delta n=1 Tax=Buchnera aphidicola TaxID=9 RepID=UPI00346426F5
MCEYRSVANIYAKAIFALAVEEKKMDLWQNMLLFAVSISKDLKIKSLLAGVLSAEYIANVFITLCGDQINLKCQNLIKIMAANKRLFLLNNVLSEFINLKNNFNKFLEVKIISAYVLNSSQLKNISLFLEKKFNRKINLKKSVKNSIIDGFIIKVNDLVIDMSIRNRLKQLQNFLNY